MTNNRNTKKLNFALLALFTFALASIGFAKANTSGTVMNNAGTAIAAAQNSAGFNTAITIQRATTAPDETTGITNNTMAGDNNPMTSSEAMRFKDVEQVTGTPPDNLTTMVGTSTVKTGAPFDNVQMTAITKTDAISENPFVQAIVTTANPQQAKIRMTPDVAGVTGSNVAGTYGGVGAANAPDLAVNAGRASGFITAC